MTMMTRYKTAATLLHPSFANNDDTTITTTMYQTTTMIPMTDNEAFDLFASVHPEKSNCTTSTCNFDRKPMQHPTIDDNDANTTAVMDSTLQRHQPPPVITDTTKTNPSKPQLPISLKKITAIAPRRCTQP